MKRVLKKYKKRIEDSIFNPEVPLHFNTISNIFAVDVWNKVFTINNNVYDKLILNIVWEVIVNDKLNKE